MSLIAVVYKVFLGARKKNTIRNVPPLNCGNAPSNTRPSFSRAFRRLVPLNLIFLIVTHTIFNKLKQITRRHKPKQSTRRSWVFLLRNHVANSTSAMSTQEQLSARLLTDDVFSAICTAEISPCLGSVLAYILFPINPVLKAKSCPLETDKTCLPKAHRAQTPPVCVRTYVRGTRVWTRAIRWLASSCFFKRPSRRLEEAPGVVIVTGNELELRRQIYGV